MLRFSLSSESVFYAHGLSTSPACLWFVLPRSQREFLNGCLLELSGCVESRIALLFGRSKKKTSDASAAAIIETSVTSQLKDLCGGDNELYIALSHLLLLDPKKIQIPLEIFLDEARDFETQGNSLRAEVAYRIAGGVSLFKGDIDGVRTYFSKAASFSGDSRPEYRVIAKRADEAVSIAKKFYETSEPLAKI